MRRFIIIIFLLWFCTCYKSLPSVLIFSSIGTLGSSYRTPGSSYRTLGSGMFFCFFKGGTKITYVGYSEYMYNFFGVKMKHHEVKWHVSKALLSGILH